jgi:hypothetical protein
MKKLRLLVSLMTRENDYQLEQAASAQQAAAGLGCDLQVIFADNDAITQGTQLLKIIQAAPATRPDAIICEPVGGPCLPQVARAAVQAGIPWVLLNRDADYLQEIRKSAPKLPIFHDQRRSKRSWAHSRAATCCLSPRWRGRPAHPRPNGKCCRQGSYNGHANDFDAGCFGGHAKRSMDRGKRSAKRGILAASEHLAEDHDRRGWRAK